MIEIPEITHELGKYWDQPGKDEFVIDQLSDYAIMTDEVFKKFHNYSHSQPTGAYEGKMWICIYGGIKYLRWFDAHPTDEQLLRTHQLEIIII